MTERAKIQVCCLECFQMLMLHILLQVQLLKQQGPRVMPGNDVLDAGLGKWITWNGAILMYQYMYINMYIYDLTLEFPLKHTITYSVHVGCLRVILSPPVLGNSFCSTGSWFQLSPDCCANTYMYTSVDINNLFVFLPSYTVHCHHPFSLHQDNNYVNSDFVWRLHYSSDHCKLYLFHSCLIYTCCFLEIVLKAHKVMRRNSNNRVCWKR